MDEFLVFRSFYDVVKNLEMVLTNLVLNWKNYHSMVQEGILLSHRVSKHGIELYKAKVEAIERLKPLTSVKDVRRFLGLVGIYMHFIKEFSKLIFLSAGC